MQIKQIKLFGVRSDLAADLLRFQHRLAVKVQNRLLSVHQRLVEHHDAVVELKPSECAADRNAVVAGDVEHQSVADLQAGEIDNEATSRSSRHRRYEIAVRGAHHLGQRSSAAGQYDAST